MPSASVQAPKHPPPVPFDQRVAGVFEQYMNSPSRGSPTERKSLARQLNCSPAKINAVEERFRAKLREAFRAYDGLRISDIDFRH